MTVTQKTALQLKSAGFPQPEPTPGQFWRNEIGQLHVMIRKTKNMKGEDCLNGFILGTDRERSVTKQIFDELYSFAPTLDHITPFLPEKFVLQIWDGLPSCKTYDFHENPIRTTGENFAEAAAKMWLEMKET